LYKCLPTVDFGEVDWSPSVPVVEFLAVWIGRRVEVFDLVSDDPDLLLYEGGQGRMVAGRD